MRAQVPIRARKAVFVPPFYGITVGPEQASVAWTFESKIEITQLFTLLEDSA